MLLMRQETDLYTVRTSFTGFHPRPSIAPAHLAAVEYHLGLEIAVSVMLPPLVGVRDADGSPPPTHHTPKCGDLEGQRPVTPFIHLILNLHITDLETTPKTNGKAQVAEMGPDLS